MGYFSKLNLEMQERVHIDRSYPSRCETLGYYMEDLTYALENRGVSVEALARSTQNGLIDFYNPRARYHYFSVLWASDYTINDLIMAVGEVARSLEKAHREEWMLNIAVLPGEGRICDQEQLRLSA